MADVVSPSVRSRMMSSIKGKNSRPEMLVRRLLFAAGYRFRLHRRDLPGTPDIVMPSRKIAIFVHGCFWHSHQGCRFAKLPTTRTEFWKAKLEANSQRDRQSIKRLQEMGWRVLCVWECVLRNPESAIGFLEKLLHWIEGTDQIGEISGMTSK